MNDDASRWNARYRAQETPASPDARVPSPAVPQALIRAAPYLPVDGTAIDLAGGNGGGALWMAERGLNAVLVEVSEVAIAQASALAASRSLALQATEMDLAGADLGSVLERVASTTDSFPPVTVISCFHYLERSLLASVNHGLPPGAVFTAAIATTTNLERNQRPSARFLLEPGELLNLVVGDSSLEVLRHREGWNESGQHEAELTIKRP